jgi:C_GCAxxG_C_C family probable redox protein
MEAIMNDNSEKASKLAENTLRDGLHCCEAILQALNEVYELGLDDAALCMATGLSGGVGGAHDLCGLVSGGVMALSAELGRVSVEQPAEEAFNAAKEYYDMVEERCGSVRCARLRDWNADPEIGHENCALLAGVTTKIAAELLETYRDKTR